MSRFCSKTQRINKSVVTKLWHENIELTDICTGWQIHKPLSRLHVQLWFYEPLYNKSSICSLTVNNMLFFQTHLTPTEPPVPGNLRAAPPASCSCGTSVCPRPAAPGLWDGGGEAEQRSAEQRRVGQERDASRNKADRMLVRPRYHHQRPMRANGQRGRNETCIRLLHLLESTSSHTQTHTSTLTYTMQSHSAQQWPGGDSVGEHLANRRCESGVRTGARHTHTHTQ